MHCNHKNCVILKAHYKPKLSTKSPPYMGKIFGKNKTAVVGTKDL